MDGPKEPQEPKPGRKRRIRNNMPICGTCNEQMKSLYYTEDNRFHVIREFIYCTKCNSVSKVVVTVLPGIV